LVGRCCRAAHFNFGWPAVSPAFSSGDGDAHDIAPLADALVDLRLHRTREVLEVIGTPEAGDLTNKLSAY
jgi:hypothetical protein